MPNGTSLGPVRPNLIVVFDNEKGFEFQVQLEAKIFSKADGLQLVDLLANRTVDGLQKAKKIALDNLDKGATDNFKAIVKGAFDENIAHLKHQKMPPPSH